MRTIGVVAVPLIGALIIFGACAPAPAIAPAPVVTTLAPVPPTPALVPTAPLPDPAPDTLVPNPTTLVSMPIKPGPGPNEVWVNNIEYWPNKIVVPVGATVTWIGRDCEGHDVESDTGLFFTSIVQGATFDYTFSERGTFYYHCECAMMAGVVIVE